jgi:hypothetical protein
MIDTQDKIVAAMSGSMGRHDILENSLANTAAGQLFATWKAFPLAGGTPSTPAVCTDDTVGALIALPSWNPATVDGHILQAWFCSDNVGTHLIYDRLAHMGGLSGTVTTAQTVNLTISTPAADGRCAADGTLVEWYVEIYTALGSTGVNCTVTYVDHADQTQTAVVIALGATPRASRIYRIIPVGKAIKSVTSLTLSATTGTAGNFGVTARKCLAALPQPQASVAAFGEWWQIGMPKLYPSTCLEHVKLCSTTSSGVCYGGLTLGAQ